MIESYCKYRKIYTNEQEIKINEEFKRLKGLSYLDHAGTTLYSHKQMENILKDFSANLYGNPHAHSSSARNTDDCIDLIRYQILDHFHTTSDDYSVIFTFGTTHALKIIAESFDYGADSGLFAYLENNHTSVLGMRDFAPECMQIRQEQAFECLARRSIAERPKNETNSMANCLFVYPAQCNFSGTKYSLDWIEHVKNGALNEITRRKCADWYVVLDAASFAATNDLNLSQYRPDFVPISFYKLFGYPCGLGALLVRRTSEHLLKKRYYGGGTVLLALSYRNRMVPRPQLHERFEDGTVPFLSIIALKHCFETIKRLQLNFDLISLHTFSLAQYVYRNLHVMHHCNGQPVAVLYHDTVFEYVQRQGSVVNFNLLRDNGDFVGYSEVLHLANLHGIHLRTGCFCNPGACQRFLRLTPNDIEKHFAAGHVCGDQNDLVDGCPTGSVRISFGYMSTREDADNFLKLIESCFVSAPIVKRMPENYGALVEKFDGKDNSIFSEEEIIENNSIDRKARKTIATLEKIFLYPVKSCGAFAVPTKWLLTSTGLKYDRQWMIVNSSGVCVTQKRNKNLCLIRPKVDLKRNTLILDFPGATSLEISLNIESVVNRSSMLPCNSKVCTDKIRGWDCGDDVANWLSDVLQTDDLRLLQMCTEGRLSSSAKQTPQLSLANQAQYLILNTESVKWLKSRIPNNDNVYNESFNSIIARFRPNFVIKFQKPFQENDFNQFTFGDNLIFNSGGNCTRCQMICIDQHTGNVSKEPLATLAKEFKGKISFGLYLNMENYNEDKEIYVDMNVYCDH